MSLLQAIDWLYAMSGFGVGLLVGMTGVGGGSLMTPVLILLFGIHPATAVGTDLLYAAATKTCGTVVHGFNSSIDWRVVGRLATGSVPMTVVTLFILSRVDLTGGAAAHFITFILSVALLATAVALVFRTRLVDFYSKRVGELSQRRTKVLTIVTGGILGILVSISSVGAGAIGVTVLLLLYPRFPLSRIVGTDIAHAVPLTLVAGAGHWLTGSVDPSMLLSLVSGSVPAIVLGSYLAPHLPEIGLRYLLALVLAVAGGKLVAT